MSDPLNPEAKTTATSEPSAARSSDQHPETLPLDRATTPTGNPSSPADDQPPSPSLAPTQAMSSADTGSIAPTVDLPTEADRTLDFVQRELKRKAAAILHTNVGDYEIERELGRGGMGVVYKARHRQLRREVALKMILAGRHAGPEQLDRFLTEARAVAQLQHPNIVQIFDIGEHEGLPYFSLEYVDGQSLSHQLNKQPQAPDEAGRTLELLARAMQYAHDHGVLHRDLKPANILMTKEDVPKISDFGLAKRVDDEESASTRTGTVMGTPSYMSPEQAMGMVHEVGPAADQYSLGAILYEMLTGRPPFMAPKVVDTILQVIHNEPIPPRQLQPGIPVDLETICLKALQKEPAKRYASCLDLAEDARRFREGSPILARPVSSAERVWRWCRRNPRVAIPSITALVLLLAFSIVLLVSYITVSNQNLVIKEERDNAQRQETRALANEKLAKDAQGVAELESKRAKEQEGIAKERAEAAKKQATLVMNNMQLILTEVDSKLSQLPNLTDTRLSVLESITKAWDQIDASVRDDEEGSAVPTLMNARAKIADVFVSLGKLDHADAEYSKLLDIAKHRITVKKGSDGARQNYAILCLKLAMVRQQVHRDMERSREYYLTAVDTLRDIIDHPQPDPTQPPIKLYAVRILLAQSIQNVAVASLRMGDRLEATRRFDEALTHIESLQSSLPTDPRFAAESETVRQKYLSEIDTSFEKLYLAKADILSRMGQIDEAAEISEILLQRRQKALESKPDDVSNKVEYARYLAHAGEFHLYNGKPEQARPRLERSVELLRDVVSDHPKIALNKDYLSFSQYRLGCALDQLGESAAAQEQFEACRQVREELASDDPTSQKRQMQRMLAYARCGDVAGALQLAEALRATARPDAEMQLEQARAMAQVARLAKSEDERESHVDAALALLQGVIDAGYRDPFKLRAEPDLKPLREDPRFAEIVKQAAAE